MHKFKHEWFLSDGYPAKGILKNGLNVFSCFSCGGGSTMGYKLAGYNVVGHNEIDPEIIEIYRLNHKPKYSYLGDIREFRKRVNLPEELFNLDILDGSPPCSTFSTSGKREEAWGKKKKFREGQCEQTLDDLFFEFINLAERLRSKVIIAENVKGMILGNAKGYVIEVKKRLEAIGYNVQLFLLNAASMGVPQKRERVFFICQRKDFSNIKIRLDFKEPIIPYSKIKGEPGKRISDNDLAIWKKRKFGDKCFSDVLKRTKGKEALWNTKFIYDNEVVNTITSTSGSKLIEFSRPCQLSQEAIIKAGTFPLDYDFLKVDPKYVVGMSVPPIMTAQIAYQVYLQVFKQ